MGGSRNKSFDENGLILAEFRFFFAFSGVLGVRGTCFFRDPKTGQNPKKSGLGPRRGRFSQLSGDLKVAHGDSATDEQKKSRF